MHPPLLRACQPCCDRQEREREGKREEIEEGKKRSSAVAMLDSRVSAMLDKLRNELEDAGTLPRYHAPRSLGSSSRPFGFR